MKNFRKVLALVLVVATLFSFAAMASAKTLADYKDADKVTTENYEVAIDVLSALEILDGYEDETFKPTNTITRAEMAKMIAVLANAGDADVDKLYAAACNFADVDKVNDWFASYVSYCAYTGIVSGRSADTFDPYGKVTGVETAKMLLVTLGFSADEQGYKGANWKLNVLRDAQNFGLLEGFAAGYDIDAAITREEAANMMLNALKAPVVVGVVSENIVKITNALYAERGMFATLIDAEKYGWVRMYGNVIVSNSVLGVELYGGRLDIDRVSDCYGRPGTQWTLKNKKGTVVFEGMFIADPMVATDYTGEIDLNDVLAEEYALGNYALTAYVDGVAELTMKKYNKADNDKDNLADFADEFIGRGVLVEVYVNDALEQITIVVINTYIGYVDATLKASDRFNVISNIGELCFSNKGYDFEQGDMILFWLCTDGATLHDAQIVEPTTAAITRAEKNNKDILDSTFTAGKVYEYALAWFFDTVNWNFGIVDDFEVGTSKNYDATWDIYTDLYGYAMYVAQHVEAPEYHYAYVVEGSGKITHAEKLGDGTVVYNAEKTFVDFDAKVNEGTAVDFDLWTETVEDPFGLLIEYCIDEDGRAYKTALAERAEGAVVLKANGDLVIGNDVIYGNDDTKYLVRTWNYETEAYEYNAYTEDTLPSGYAGYYNVNFNPELVEFNGIQYFSTYAGEAVSEQAEVLTYVFIDAQFALAANRALILDVYKSVTDAKFINKIGACDYYEAVVNGTAGYVILTDEDAISVANGPVLIETDLEVVGLMDNGLPVYLATRYINPNAAGPFEFVAGELVNGNVSWDLDDDFFAVIVDPAGDAHVFTDAADLNAYVESMEAWIHATFCDEAADDEEICEVYAWLHAWQFNAGGKIDQLYAVIDTTALENAAQ